MFVPAVPDVPEIALAVQRSYPTSSCEVHMIWHSNVDADKRNLTNFLVKANASLMSPDLFYVNDTWISSLFNVPSCEPHNISVSANNSCGESDKSSVIVWSSEIRQNINVNISTDECIATTNPIDVCSCPTEPPCEFMMKYNYVIFT